VAAPKIELPSSDADYLNNPKPPYPLLSKRMGEQGRVVVRTLIGTDGHAQDVQLHQSSGFDRLDQAALNAARQWRYVPGKRDGVPQAMWFNVPFTFQLQ
jgi:protein TonB